MLREGFVLAALSVCLGSGCVTESFGIATGQSRLSFSNATPEHTAHREVDAAHKLMKEGRYSAAIPQLVSTISQYPKTVAAVDAYYFLGVSYYEVAGYRDADQMLRTYLDLAPGGAHAKDSNLYLDKLRSDFQEHHPASEETQARIDELTAALSRAPRNIAYRSELAGLLWRRGDYEAATRMYARILETEPGFAEDERFTSRIDVSEGGEFIPLTPTEIQRRQIEGQPLLIVNENAFIGNRFQQTQKAQSYFVTGQVLNRRNSILYGVQVYVTIFGFGNLVYDTATVDIGQLQPGEKRAFSVSFSNFENIENIDRHESIGTFVH